MKFQMYVLIDEKQNTLLAYSEHRNRLKPNRMRGHKVYGAELVVDREAEYG